MTWVTVKHRVHGGVTRIPERSLASYRRRGWDVFEPEPEPAQRQSTPEPEPTKTRRRPRPAESEKELTDG